jgi:predicted phosphate transport protein (TIGR00153 family)
MIDWFHRLMPREEAFFPLFAQHARLITTAAVALRKLMNGGPDMRECYDAVMTAEQRADDAARQVFIRIRSTFVTPFDRGDIKDLITAMDDAIDQMQKTAKSIALFELTEFEPEMREMADAIVDSAQLVEQAIPLLANIGRNVGELNRICVRISQIEGQADETHDRGLKKLYARVKSGDAMQFIRSNEIFDHLEKCVDRFDDVANQIQGIVIEHV